MLERFKKSPTQDPDPQTRLAALLELPADHEEVAKARTDDPDEGVRAKLVDTLTSLEAVEARRTGDSSPRVIDAAAARLRHLIADADAVPAADVEAYIASCPESDLLAYCALHATAVSQRRAALARHATLADANAHRRLQLDVASRDADEELKTEALAAIDNPVTLEQLVLQTRKSDKVSHRFAKERLKQLRDAEAAASEINVLRKDLKMRARMPVTATSEAIHHAVALQQQWEARLKTLTDEIAATGTVPDFSDDVEAIEKSIGAARQAMTDRDALLAEVGAAEGELNRDALRTRWQAIPDSTPRETEQFEQALIAWITRETKKRAALNAWDAAGELLDAADTEGATTTLKEFESQWAALGLGDPADDTQRALVERHDARLEKLQKDALRLQAARERAVSQAEALLDKFRSALDDGQISAATSACDRLTHRLRKKEHLSGPTLAKLEKGLGELAPKLAELKQARIWSTQQARQELIAEVEALSLDNENVNAGKRATHIRTLREKWRELDHGVGPAHEDIWKRFDSGCKAAYEPAKVKLDEAARERGENKTAKVAVCESLEKMAGDVDASAPDFKAIEKALNDARKRMRDIGPVNHRDVKALRKRFDAAVDGLEKFVAPERERELRRRQLAIKSLETAIENEPLASQIDLAKRIQREWAPTVRSRRREEQKMWERLRGLCDGIFEQRNEVSRSRKAAEDEVSAARSALLDELAGLGNVESDALDDAAAKALTASYNDLKSRWRDAGDVSPRKRQALQGRYRDLCKRIDGILKDVRRRAGAQRDQALLERIAFVDERWRALAGGQAAPEAEPESAISGPLARLVSAAETADPKVVQGTARADLALRAELDADIDSPAALASERMRLKVERLNAAMAGASTPPPRELVAQLVEAWLKAPLCGDDSDLATWQRFRAALDALVHRR